MLTSVSDLAAVHLFQGRYDDAETFFQRALAGRKKHLGTDHPDTLVSLNDFACFSGSGIV